MAVPLIAAGVAAASSLAQLGIGLSDRAKGRKQREKAQSFFEENKYAIPESAKAALGVAQRGAETFGLPGQDIAEAKLGESVASGIGAARRAARTPSEILASVTGMVGQQMEQQQNLALDAARNYQLQQQNLQGQLGRMAGFEEERWRSNVLYPYQQQMTGAGQLAERGTAGLSAGISGLGQTAAGLGQYMGAQQGFQSRFPQQREIAPPMMTPRTGTLEVPAVDSGLYFPNR